MYCLSNLYNFEKMLKVHSRLIEIEHFDFFSTDYAVASGSGFVHVQGEQQIIRIP